MKATYLDHNATRPLRPEARARWLQLTDETWAHARSLHAPGLRAGRAWKSALEGMAGLLGAPPSALVVTSGATESNHTALRHLSLCAAGDRPVRWAVGAGEHPSVTGTLEALCGDGLATMRIVSRRASGAIDLDELERALEESDALCLQAANHETGVITDLETVGRLVRDAALPWHCDAVQAIGRLPVHFESTGAGAITTMSASGHKLGGPKGVGLLLVRGALLRPLLPGEDGDTTRRAGTPDVASAGATLAALEAAMAEVDEGLIARLQQHRDAMESGLLSRFPGAVVHGGDAERLPNTLSISLPRHDGGWPDGEELVLALAAHGVACSTGAACATGSGRPSPVLSAMGVPVEVAAASLRLSIGHPTTQEDVSHVLWAIEEVLSSDRGAL